MRTIFKLSIIVSVAFLVLFFIFKREKPQGMPPKVVETETSQSLTMRGTNRFIGTVKAKHFCIITAKAAGIIDTLAQAGTAMKKGEILAKIENPDIEKTYELCKAAEAIAKSQYARVAQLAKSGASSKGALEDKEKALIESQKALAAAKIEFDNVNIKAPFDGILGVYKVNDGEHVQVGERIVSFYDPNAIVIDFDIPDELIKDLHNGQGAFVNGTEYSVKHIQRAIDEEKHMCPAYIEMDDNKSDFVIGASVYVDLVTEEHAEAVVVHKSSVFLKNNQNSVYVLKSDGSLELRAVKLGIQQREQVEISEGLAAGEKVILTGQDRLFPGLTVKDRAD